MSSEAENVVEAVDQKSRSPGPFHTGKVFVVSIRDLPGIIFAHSKEHEILNFLFSICD